MRKNQFKRKGELEGRFFQNIFFEKIRRFGSEKFEDAGKGGY